jgi:GGDEF domain-containing protein
MPFTPLLLILIAIILVADVAIVATASARRDHGSRRSTVHGLVRSGQQLGSSAGERVRAWRSMRSVRSGSGSGSASGRPGRRPAAASREDARTAAAIEAFVADVDGRAGDGLRRRAPAAENGPTDESGTELTTGGPLATPAARVEDLSDSPRSATWDALLADESERVRRFGRPATVVLAQCPGLDIVAARLGAEAADRIVAEIDRVLHAESRATDRVVRLGPARFGVLMVETGSAEARRYVDRVRDGAGRWFASAGLSPRLAIGWASPDDGEDLGAAAATALLRARAADVEPRIPIPG